MPQEAPDSLGAEAYVDIVSYLFKANGSPAGSGELTPDRARLQQVQAKVRAHSSHFGGDRYWADEMAALQSAVLAGEFLQELRSPSSPSV